MMFPNCLSIVALSVAAVLPLTGCDRPAPEPAASTHAAESPTAPTNRVAIPSAVRTNLGITFATAQRRSIQQTLRAPGRFEYLPTATRAYRTMLPGRVDVLVEQFEHVEEGTPLYRIDAPAWRDMQQAIAQADATVIRLHTTASTFGHQLRAHQRHEESLQDSIAIWNRRIERLEALREAGGGRLSEFTTAQTSLASAQADLASAQEKDAELLASRLQTEAAMQAAKAEQSLALDAAAAVLGLDVDALIAPSSNVSDAPPTWRAIKTIEVKATAPGVVASIDLTLGAWADAQAPVVTVVQPDRLRFHATGLQSDLGVLQSGLRVSIVPPTPTLTGTAVPMDSVMHGTLALGLSGDPDERTIDLYVTPDELAPWARSGVSAQLEIVTNGSAAQELAIPLAAVQRDGLMPVIFRRAPDNANEAIRIEADLGLDDGRWVVVRSGLRDGDEVVLDGGFQLMLATSGAVQKGGHFHSDGTFHEGEH